MYGYFRPNSSHLTREEQRVFHAYYCRVCYCLRLLGGQPARFFTTFDMAVYSLLLNIEQKHSRPTYHKCEKFSTTVLHEFDNDEVGKRLANMSIILFGEKMRDDKIDGNRIRYLVMELLFHKTVKQAYTAEPEIAEIAHTGTDRINRAQHENEGMNKILGLYSSMIADMFYCICEMDDTLMRVIRSITAWTFYIDMIDDYNSDYKSKAYNGFRVDGLKTLDECFDKEYMTFIKRNEEITGEIRNALYDVKNESIEWRIVHKILDAALEQTIPALFSTRRERIAMSMKQFAEKLNLRLPSWKAVGANGK